MFEFMQPIADSLGLSLQTLLIICAVAFLIIAPLILNQAVAMLSDTKRSNAGGTKTLEMGVSGLGRNKPDRKRVRD